MGQTILIVEDDKDLRENICSILQNEGFQTTEAQNGTQALDKLLPSVSLVILDIMMPGIDGLEATRRIRALDREDAATTPIIAVSANAFADDRRLSREAGMDAHLSKPVSSQELVEALAHIAADAS